MLSTVGSCFTISSTAGGEGGAVEKGKEGRYIGEGGGGGEGRTKKGGKGSGDRGREGGREMR